MTLSELSIKNTVFAVMLMAALIVFGTISFRRLGISQNPDVEFPIVTITAALPGAAPEVMESDVTEILEEAVSTVEGIKSLSSTSVQGVSAVQIEFELNRPIDIAVQEVRDKVAGATRLLPKDIDPPIVTKVNPQDSPIMWIALSGQRTLQDLTEYANEVLKPEFQTISGVGEILIGGGRRRTIRVWVDAKRLEAYGLGIDDVTQALQRQHVEVPGGRIESRAIEFNVRTVGEAPSVSELNEIIIRYQHGTPISLNQVAYVEDGLADKRSVARYTGIPSVGMGIRKQRGANTVAVAQGARKVIDEMQERLPEGMRLVIAFDSSQYIEDAIRELELTLILAVILTSLVTFFFLGSVRSTIIISLAIPTSLIGTFFVMYVLNFTLNTMTLLALSLSVGIVVDDAIMVLENIYRHREHGESRVEAALVGSKQITFAALAATVAIVAIFLPVAFMKGIIGRFFFEFGVTISVAVLLSLLVALTLTPMLCSRFLDAGTAQSRFSSATERLYDRAAVRYGHLLRRSLHHRWLVIAIALVGFFASFGVMRFVGKEFVPAQDQGRFMVNIETPVGSSVDYTDGMLRRCEEFFGSLPEIQGFFAAVGAGGQERGVNKAIMFVSMIPQDERRRSQQEIIGLVRSELNQIPGMLVIPFDPSQSGFSAQRGFPIEFSVRGPSLEKLHEYSDTMMARMREIPGIVDVDSDFEVGMPEVNVEPDRKRAADAGVDMAAIGRTVGALIGGVDVAKFKDRGKRYDVRLRLVADQRTTPDDIGKLYVRNTRGDLIPVRDVARIDERPSLQVISRRDRQRAISVFANLTPEKAQAEALDQIQQIATEILPEGYRIALSGSSQAFQESFSSLLFALFLGIAVAYMILGSQFNHFAHPFTVLTALPFSFTGAILALWVTGNTLNIYSMIGIILLMGLVKKNSIILVDFTNQLRVEGKSQDEALLTACPIRLRPILMTSISTIVGAIPACLALGPGAETRIPMGITVIGGIIFSTALTLFVVPAVYTLLDDLTEWLRKGR
ncbi:MAG: efflux RND transporter permease subunit [Candidatus Latescibacteria bacterium]|nr:efflux RND transporter permease subunit [Candidatus Latescibacterota bacterium]